MADTFTGTSQLSGAVLTAYQRSAFFALRSDVVFDQIAMVKPGSLTSPGSPVSFYFWTEMSQATTALSETVDVDAVGLASSAVTVTPYEYGNAVLLTRKLRAIEMLIGFDPDVANLVNFNMVDSIDRLARNALDAAGTLEYVTGTTAVAQVSTSIITAALARKQEAKLRGGSALPMSGSDYLAIAHPDVAYDLKKETGDAGWVSPAVVNNYGAVLNNEIGRFASMRWVESPRAYLLADGGSSAVDLYYTYFLGREALAKAVAIAPHIVIGPVTDRLQRFQPIGWYCYQGWGQLRSAASRRLGSASSIGTNS
jgi:N4-gp56 family major capsid protein